jgi:periplasmic protein CpxP/Spy
VNRFVKRIFLASVMSMLLTLALGAWAYQDSGQDAAPPPPPQGGAPPEGHQGPHGHGPRGTPQQRLEHLSTQLNLTDDQKAKIKPILEDEDAKMKALWQDTSTQPEDKRGKFMAIHQTSNDQIKSVLTDEQQKKFADMQERMHQRMKDRGGDNN